MPYIDQALRLDVDSSVDAIATRLDSRWEPGVVNYTITRILIRWWKDTYQGGRYKTICLIMGTLVCVAFEFYRRVAAGYEDKKAKENGDVY